MKPKKAITYKSDDEDKLLHSKQREIFEDAYKKRLDKIEELTTKIDDKNLKFTTLSTGRGGGHLILQEKIIL